MLSDGIEIRQTFFHNASVRRDRRAESGQNNSPGSHRSRLRFTRRLCRRLEQLVAESLIRQSLAVNHTVVRRTVISVLATACLARRALLPAWLGESPVLPLFRALLQGKEPLVDKSSFGRRLTVLAESAGDVSGDCTFVREATELLSGPEARHLLEDPHLPGWSAQCLGEQRRLVVAGMPPDASPQSVSSRDIHPRHLPALTQWFTPEWIARFLVEETVGSYCRQTPGMHPVFFDPACGAGHILTLALRTLVAERQNASRQATPAVLESVLGQQLYGCDIDAAVIQSAALSVYLTSRELLSSGELPLPNLFHFDVENSPEPARQAVGSLWFGVEPPPADLPLNHLGTPLQLGRCSLIRQFDIIVTNPPYLSHRLMPAAVSSIVKAHYQPATFDLYGAFLLLALRLLSDGGYLGMICQQSFMSVQRYERLRQELSRHCEITSLVQLGPGVFAARAGEKVNNAIVIARRTGRPPESDSCVRCWRVLEPADKARAERDGIASLPEIRAHQSQFGTISGARLSFWCPPEVSALFRRHPPLESSDTGITLTNGLFTCNNARFVKMHWQVTDEERPAFVPYDKGGGHKWYRTTPYMLYWGGDGSSIRDYRALRGQSRRLPGEQFYFRDGVTYSYIGTRGFRARLLSPGAAFDIASSAAFSKNLDPLYLLGFLNSSAVRFLLGVLNPTINFQIGDLRRLPFALPDARTAEAIIREAATAVKLAREVDSWDPCSPQFQGPVLFRFNGDGDEGAAYQRFQERAAQINRQEAEIQRTIDELVFELYEISQRNRAVIEADPWVARQAKPLVRPPTFQQCLKDLEGWQARNYAMIAPADARS